MAWPRVDGAKRSDSGCVLKAGLTESGDRLDVACKREEDVKRGSDGGSGGTEQRVTEGELGPGLAGPRRSHLRYWLILRWRRKTLEGLSKRVT